MTTQFEQGNQARLDVTRSELRTIESLLLFHRESLTNRRNINVEYIQNTDNLLKKVREALDLYQ